MIIGLSMLLAYFIFSTISLIVIEFRLARIQKHNAEMTRALTLLLPTAQIIPLQRGNA